jgi:hypothetical protein
MTTSVAKQTIFQGDSTKTFRVKFDGIDVAICSCKQSVRESADQPPIVSETITDTVTVGSTNYFQVSLKPAQTSLLDVGNWIWGIEIEATGTTPPQRRETHIDLEVEAQIVT